MARTELLNPEQANQFRDNYLDIEFDFGPNAGPGVVSAVNITGPGDPAALLCSHAPQPTDHVLTHSVRRRRGEAVGVTQYS